MADSGTPLIDPEAQTRDAIAPPRMSPLEQENSEKDHNLPEQGQNGVHDGEGRVRGDSTGLIWPVLLVVVILLSLTNRQFWPRNLASGSDVAVSWRPSRLFEWPMLLPQIFSIDRNHASIRPWSPNPRTSHGNVERKLN